MPQGQLTSWKEIAAHLGVSVRTAQRWETTENLPVRRHQHSKLSSVYADATELTRWWENRPASTPGPSIAVLPFANLDRDEETEILSDGLTEDLITMLSQVQRLRVVARSSVFWFKGKTRDLREIGSRLGVDHVLEGSLRRRGNRLRVTAQLVSARDGCHLWAERFDCEMDDPFDLQDQLSHAIAASLRVRLLEDAPPRRARDTETYNLFLRGRFFWNQRNPQSIERAFQCFQEVVSRDPDFAAGWAGLADCYCFLWNFAGYSFDEMTANAEAAAARALELDPMLAEAYTSQGMIRIGRIDMPGAEEAFRRALNLNPGESRARHWRAMTLLCLGRREEALNEIEQALELDPFGSTVNQDAGRILYSLGRYEEAIVRLRHTLEIAPHVRFAAFPLGLALIQTGDYESALAAVAADPVFAAFVRALMGEVDEARRLLQSVGGPPLGLARQAILHLALGQEAEAIALFRRGMALPELETLELHRAMLLFFRDPKRRAELDSLTANPRSAGQDKG